MKQQKFNGAAKTLLLPIDWGITFTRNNLGALFVLALVPITLEFFASYILYSSRLMRQQAMLVFVVSSIANVWLLIAAVMLVLESIRGAEIRLLDISQRALIALPKVLISYFATFFLITLGFRAFIIPGLVFVGFLIWAPAFCVGELYARSSKRKDDDVEPEGEGDTDNISFFTNRPIWDLGLARSWRVAGPNFFASFQLALLFLASFVVPMALVDLMGSATLGFAAQAAKVLLTSLLGVLVKGVWAGTFVMMLPKEARQEIGITAYPDPGRVSSLRYEGRLGPQLFVLILCSLSTWVVVHFTIERTKMPMSVASELLSVEKDREELVVKLRLVDQYEQFRWFVPEQFRLQFAGAQEEAEVPVEAESPQTAPSASGRAGPEVRTGTLFDVMNAPSNSPGSNTRVFAPSSVIAFDQNGKIIPTDNLSPFSEPLTIELRFGLRGKQDVEGEPFTIHYMSFSGLGDAVLQGELRPGWS